MKLMVVFDVEGMTAAQYDAVISALEKRGQSAPVGRISHAAAPRPGGWLVVDTYESEIAFERFGGQLMPVLGSFGIAAEPRIFPAHSVVVAPAAVPA